MKYKCWYITQFYKTIYRYFSYGVIELIGEHSIPQVGDILGTMVNPYLSIEIIKVEEI